MVYLFVIGALIALATYTWQICSISGAKQQVYNQICNRGMMLLLIEKIKQTGNARFIPLLKAWKEIEYKKVQTEIQKVIESLIKEGTIF
jgi:hypothetical protein